MVEPGGTLAPLYCEEQKAQKSLTYPKNAHFGIKRSDNNQQIKRDEFYRITKRSIIPDGMDSVNANPDFRVKRSLRKGPRFLIIKGGIVCESLANDAIFPELMDLPEGEYQSSRAKDSSHSCAPGENCLYSKRDSSMRYF